MKKSEKVSFAIAIQKANRHESLSGYLEIEVFKNGKWRYKESADDLEDALDIAREHKAWRIRRLKDNVIVAQSREVQS